VCSGWARTSLLSFLSLEGGKGELDGLAELALSTPHDMTHTSVLLPFTSLLQVSMESNGKGVDVHGQRLPFDAGEIDFGACVCRSCRASMHERVFVRG
jgi:hypothetical protein